jgi:hypothetical protein
VSVRGGCSAAQLHRARTDANGAGRRGDRGELGRVTILSTGEPVTASHCILFRQLMQAELAMVIPGARVSSLVTPNLPVTNFP